MINKKNVIMITMILSVIYLLYSIMVLTGLWRYMKMYYSNPEKYLDTYKNIDSLDNDKNIVTLTTDNIDSIKPVINSILDQTVSISDIILVVPYGEEFNLPIELKDAVKIMRTEYKHNKLSPIMANLITEGEGDTNLILLQDDKIYGKNFIEKLLSHKKKNHVIYQNNKDFIDVNKPILIPLNIVNSEIMNLDGSENTNEWLNKSFKYKKRLSYKGNYNKL